MAIESRIMVTRMPTGRLRAKNKWDVWKSVETPDAPWWRRLLGLATTHNHVARFDSRDDAIDYALDIANNGEAVYAHLKSGGQTRVDEEHMEREFTKEQKGQ